jgi:hypothetical protein
VNRPGFVTVLAFCLLLARESHAALQVGAPLWGFDGKVRSRSFNVVSVEVSNRSAQPFDGRLVLDSQGSGAPAAQQQVYLAPGSSRWVQFFPYIGSYVPNWRLSWDDGRGHAEDLGQPGVGPPATVILADPNALGARAVRMRLFPENLFPATVSATDGLSAVVLDHQPHWEAPRREAFLDWLRRGGIVHLLPGADGTLPKFTDDLAVLGITSGDRQRVGAGLVVKHTIGRAEITEEWFKEHGFPQPEVRSDGQGAVDIDNFCFSKLGAVTRPNINWALIYSLTLLYVVLIGPVFYVLRKRNYRLLLGGFLATVVLFAWVFTVIGRRGYGEKQIYHTLAIARPLGGGRFDVHEWIHAFATSGDTYRFEHAGGGHLYGTASSEENVRGEIVTGRESHFSADIPLFSSRPFLHRGVMKADDPRLKVEHWGMKAGSASLNTLRVSAAPEFHANVFTAVLEHDGRYSEMAVTGEGFELREVTRAKPASEYFGPNYYDEYGDADNIIRTLRSLHPLFISFANGEGAYFKKRLAMPPRSADQARLFLYAEGPPEFGIKNDRFQRGQSLVLYVMDIFKP